MPWDNLPQSEWDKMDRCIADVQKQGETEQAAIAICYTSITGKSIDPHDIKIGAAISKATMQKLQAAHDALAELGACPMDAQSPDAPAEDAPDPEDMPMPMPEKSLVFFGGEVKALGNGKVGGYLVRFSSAKDPDLTGDYFTADTHFGNHAQSPVLYQHGMDVKMGGRVIGTGNLTTDNIGVWIEAQLEMRDEYEKAIYEMAQAGKLGWSSGTASHLVEREQTGKAAWIKSWPLGLDASLTPTPAEPRNGAVPLKSLIIGSTPQEPDGVLADAASKSIVSALPEMESSNMTPEEIKALAVAAVEEYKRSEPATASAGVGRVEVVKDESDHPFKSAGEFLQAVRQAGLYPGREDPRLKAIKASGMSEGIPADGGYLLQPQYATGIVERMYATGSILSRVANLEIGANSNSMIINGVDETSRADGSRNGGVLGYWLGEGSTKTATKPKFRQLELKLKKVAAVCYGTDELMEDATALGSWLNRVVPDELRFKAEDAIVNGNGVGKPLGIMAAPSLVSVTRVDGSKVQAADILAMYARRWVGTRGYAWFVNQDVVPQLLQLGSTYQNWFLPPGGLSQAPYGTLLGFPVIETEYNQTLGTTGDIILADMSQYQVIQKGGVQAASSIHVQFLTDESVYRFVYRIDGAPLWHSALTPKNGSNTQSPFVCLTTAS